MPTTINHLRIASGLVALAFAVAACSGSTDSESSTDSEASKPAFSQTTQFASAEALLTSMVAAGQPCEAVRSVAPTDYMATLASCDSDLGQLDAYTFSDQSQQNRWHDTFKPLCGNPIGDKYIRGNGWAIVAAAKANGGSQLAGSLGITAASWCDSNPA